MLPTLVIIIISLIWGSTFWIIKVSLKEISVMTLMSYRFLLAAIVLLPWVYLYRSQLRKNLYGGLVMGGVLWGAYVLQFFGLTMTTAANSGFITGLYLIFVPAFQYLVHKRGLQWIQGSSIVVALSGLWLLTHGIQGVNAGDILTVVSASCIGAQILLVDHFTREDTNLFLLNFIQFFVVGVLSLGVGLCKGEIFVLERGTSYVVLGYLGIIATVFCFFGQFWAQKYISAVKASLLFMIEPLSAAIFAWTMGDEIATTYSVMGGLIVLVGVSLPDLQKVLKTLRSG